jgi:hypothetical protein
MPEEIIGLEINIQTMNENLDIRTFVYADVYQGDNKITQEGGIQIAAGEVEEWQYHYPAYIPFVNGITDQTNLSIELRHPGISSNSDPHWRMRFWLVAITENNRRLGCGYSLQQSPIFVDEHGGQLNFEGNARNSGRIPFLVLT